MSQDIFTPPVIGRIMGIAIMTISRRELASGFAAAALTARLSTPALATTDTGSACPAFVDPISLVDPDLLPWLRTALSSGNGLSEQHPTLASIRPKFMPPLSAAAQMRARIIPGLDGHPDVRVIPIGGSNAKGRQPAILHIHGGGYVSGRADDSVDGLIALAAKLREPCFIVSVDYRLAPETRFPGALHDLAAALRWLHQKADSLGIDRSRISIMGESAGGGHAAALSLFARDNHLPVKAQFLTYPMLDDRTGSTRCSAGHIGTFMWTAAQNRLGWSALLGMPAGSANTMAGAVPARAPTVKGLPRTFIAVGSIDLFIDEDMQFARRLVDAGVPTELHVIPGAFHGFDQAVPTARVTQEYHAALIRAINRFF